MGPERSGAGRAAPVAGAIAIAAMILVGVASRRAPMAPDGAAAAAAVPGVAPRRSWQPTMKHA